MLALPFAPGRRLFALCAVFFHLGTHALLDIAFTQLAATVFVAMCVDWRMLLAWFLNIPPPDADDAAVVVSSVSSTDGHVRTSSGLLLPVAGVVVLPASSHWSHYRRPKPPVVQYQAPRVRGR